MKAALLVGIGLVLGALLMQPMWAQGREIANGWVTVEKVDVDGACAVVAYTRHGASLALSPCR